MSKVDRVLKILGEIDVVHPKRHVHRSPVVFERNTNRAEQNIVICVAPKKTAYKLSHMRWFQEIGLAGLGLTAHGGYRFDDCGYLTYGQLTGKDKVTMNLEELMKQPAINGRPAIPTLPIELRQNITVVALPCKALLRRHPSDSACHQKRLHNPTMLDRWILRHLVR